MDEKPEKPRLIAKEDVTPLIIAGACLLITLYLFFGPSPVKMLFSSKPPAQTEQTAPDAQNGQPQSDQSRPGMMPANAVPEAPAPSEEPERTEKPK